MDNISIDAYADIHADWVGILDEKFGAGKWYVDNTRGKYVFDNNDTHDAFTAADPRVFDNENHADAVIALPFYRNAYWGIAEVFDVRYLAYVTHVHMHHFNIHRWRFNKAKDETRKDQILLHWFAGRSTNTSLGPAVHKSNTAGRLWWLANMSEKAAKYKPIDQTLSMFCKKADMYHEPMSRSCFHNPDMIAAFMAECPDSAYITKAGIQKLCKMSNQEATGRVLDMMSYDELREMIHRHVRYVMAHRQYVSDRGAMIKRRVIRVLSLGAGVQSTVMALMANLGWIYGGQKPDFAIFADTKWEPPEVYEHLKWLRSQLSFEVKVVDAGDLRDNLMNGVDVTGHPHLEVPVFLTTPEGKKVGVGRRECTSSYKIKPIQRMLREHMGLKKGEQVPWDTHVEMWLGISTDEVLRQKPSQMAWITNKWPLIDRGMSRRDCRKLFDELYPGRHLPRSACIGCPYRNDAEWHEMKVKRPDLFRDAVEVDEALRKNASKTRLRNIPYIHKSGRPLAEVVFDAGVVGDCTFDDESECDGMCGV